MDIGLWLLNLFFISLALFFVGLFIWTEILKNFLRNRAKKCQEVATLMDNPLILEPIITPPMPPVKPPKKEEEKVGEMPEYRRIR